MNKKILILGLTCFMPLTFVGCNKDNSTVTEKTQEIDPNLAEAGPVNQEKKKDLNSEDSLGDVKYKISDAWNKTTKEGTNIYVLNDEEGSHIQVAKVEIPKDVPEKDYLEISDAFLDQFFKGSSSSPFLEKEVSGQKIHGKKGTIESNGSSVDAITYVLVKGTTMYRFTAMSHIKLSDEDAEIFSKMVDSIQIN